ncbi:hypothetical protein F2Q69_00035765 [Brassica cretica]|uniref:Aspartic peptidase DDI1-type domain-containing protein n=1 Tax=Brassica cretica TaxID=69181 RepID=A0A8S9SNB2_BRACR|nr:hypothetical protein F2Q69_00035765 [Brassica cretica]
MFFRETKETEEDIRRMFHHVRERMKLRITLKKKSDSGKFAIPCMVKGIEFPHALHDTGASVSILQRSSGGIIRDLEVQIGNALVPVDFNVLDIKLNWKSSLRLGRAFLATVRAVCDMNTNRLCLTLINPDVHYDLVRVVRQQRETDIDRLSSPPIDRQALLTYRVRLPSIDSDRINALRPPPKPLANPPEPTTNPSDTTQEPMKIDEATEGRRLRKRKEKIPKNLKREANEKDMDGFTKRVLRIPVEKPFDEVYYTHRLWMFFRETKETEEDIRRMFHHVREMMKLRITLKKKSDPGKFVIPCVVKEYSKSIDTHTASSIDSNESPTTDEHYPTSLDGNQPVDHFTLPDQCYTDFAFQQPNKKRRDDYSIGSWADSGFHESFAVETVIPSSNEDPTEEYDEDYWKERAIEIAMQDERYSSHSFNNTSPPSIDRVYSASVDTHPHPAKRSYASIDTTPGTSIDIKAAAFEKEKGNIPIPSRFTNTYIRSFAPQITSHDTIAEKMNAPTNKSEGTSRKSIRSKNPNSADKRLPSIDTPVSTSIDSHSKPKLYLFTKKNMSIDYGFLTLDEFGIFRDPNGHARAMDGRILQVSREDIEDILQLANGPDNLFMQQCSIPDNIPAVPDKHPRADTTEIGSHQSCQPVGQTLIYKDALTSFDRAPSPTIDRRYECRRALMTSMEPESSDGNRRTNMVSTEMSLDMQGA